ncbi:hypothetical protein ACH4RA_34570 [Streptomyces smyrnaeus]|nr:hypothetical protein [Streptomyces sp. RK75]
MSNETPREAPRICKECMGENGNHGTITVETGEGTRQESCPNG